MEDRASPPPRSRALKRARKQRGIAMSLAGISVGFLIALVFRFAGYWDFDISEWINLLALTAAIHLLFVLALHRGWDRFFPWDPHFIYLPSLSVVLLFFLFVLESPEARVLIPFGFFVNLLFLVGLAGFVETFLLSGVMAAGYFFVAYVLVRRGEDVSLGYEAIIALILLALGGFAATVLERSLRRRTETLRTAAELRTLSRAVEQSPSLLILTDTTGAIEYVNPRFCETTGYGPDEVLGKTPSILKSPDTPRDTYADLWETITAGREWKGELKNLKKGGEPYWVIASVSPIRDEQGDIRHYLGVQEDITERKRVEARLVQAQKMEGVGQLVSGVAHDFNNLLTGVLGFAELAMSRLAPSDPAYDDLLQIKTAGESASSLTHQLLAFSRQQMLAPKILDLNEVVATVSPLLRRSVNESIELVTCPDPGLGRVRADPSQIQQVLMNLAVNARDAMPDGGRLEISTGNETLGEDFSGGSFAIKPGPYVRLTVADTGCGMTEKVRSRVFEPFFTTKERGRGTGLGLATVFGIIKQNLGYIVVDSRPGEGAKFSVYLPQVADQPAEPAEPAQSARSVVGSERVLLVEDDDVVRGLAKRVLEQHGYRVQAADGPAAALQAANGDHLDLLVTDVVMPQMSGVELAQRLRDSRPHLKVLLLSGYTAQDTVRRIANDPTMPLLTKPFEGAELLRTVRRVLDSEAGPDRAEVH